MINVTNVIYIRVNKKKFIGNKQSLYLQCVLLRTDLIITAKLLKLDCNYSIFPFPKLFSTAIIHYECTDP